VNGRHPLAAFVVSTLAAAAVAQADAARAARWMVRAGAGTTVRVHGVAHVVPAAAPLPPFTTEAGDAVVHFGAASAGKPE
jgi:hypothetical protein